MRKKIVIRKEMWSDLLFFVTCVVNSPLSLRRSSKGRRLRFPTAVTALRRLGLSKKTQHFVIPVTTCGDDDVLSVSAMCVRVTSLVILTSWENVETNTTEMFCTVWLESAAYARCRETDDCGFKSCPIECLPTLRQEGRCTTQGEACVVNESSNCVTLRMKNGDGLKQRGEKKRFR
ncbi:hypothetical protein CDAR_204011 [Caerostris darwini]|uniref:Uncharacterized protein n=1 Tax=Caerostris darwini TaxID=1538125 RepID=A0AAV4RRH1_9ARAC|nr:hypothetical protein CDAR_204011 [Caerostris darwini]